MNNGYAGRSNPISIRATVKGNKMCENSKNSAAHATKHGMALSRAHSLDVTAQEGNSFDIHQSDIGKQEMECLFGCGYKGPVETFFQGRDIKGEYGVRCPGCYVANGRVSVEFLMQPNLRVYSLKQRLRASLQDTKYNGSDRMKVLRGGRVEYR
jgi:hypothetical protein